MAKPTWIIDPLNTVELVSHLFMKKQILLNGREAASQRVKGTTVIPFSLNGGRAAQLTISYKNFSSPDIELRVEGRLILSEREKKDMACLKCGASVSPADKFCEKCGKELPGAEIQKKIVKLKAARNSIRFIAIMFFIFGVAVFLIKTGQNAPLLQSLAQYQDNDIYPKLVAGKQVTAGYLRQALPQEAASLLAINLLLGTIMLGLFFYAKKSPLVALLIAMGVYAAVIVLNAIIDPISLGQGFVLKIFIFAVLTNGVRMALELRKIEA